MRAGQTVDGPKHAASARRNLVTVRTGGPCAQRTVRAGVKALVASPTIEQFLGLAKDGPAIYGRVL